MNDLHDIKPESLISRFLNRLIDIIGASILSAFLTIPATIFLGLRKLITGKAIFNSIKVYNREAQPTNRKVFNSSNWLVSNATFYPKVLFGSMRLVGVSQHMVEATELSELDRHIIAQVPGVLSLYFLRSGTRIAYLGQSELDKEYLAAPCVTKNLKILLKSIPAIMYYNPSLMDSDHFDLFGITMLNISMADAIALLNERIETQTKSHAFFVNADCLNKIFVDTEYYQILKENKLTFPDGIGINIALRMTGGALKENVNGTDMLPYLCDLCSAKHYKLFLLGAAPGVAEVMRLRLIEKYPSLNICGVQHGFFDWDTPEALEIIARVNSAEADILLVAFGAPNQEKFISRFSSQLNPSILMGVGGLFDFYSGRIPRAPYWMREIGCEWVFRLMKEPKRMWRRYILGNPLFLYRVSRWIKSKLK